MSLRCLGGTGVPCPPLCVLFGVWSLFLSGYAVLWGACGLVWEEGGCWGGGFGVFVYEGVAPDKLFFDTLEKIFYVNFLGYAH